MAESTVRDLEKGRDMSNEALAEIGRTSVRAREFVHFGAATFIGEDIIELGLLAEKIHARNEPRRELQRKASALLEDNLKQIEESK